MGKIKGSFATSYDKFVKRSTLLPAGLLELIKSYNAHSILELGCGTGTVAVGLAREGFDVTGVDYSPDMLAAAEIKAAEHGVNIKLVEDDIGKLNFGRRFDLVLCLGNITPQFVDGTRLRRLLGSALRHLEPGGQMVIQQLNYDRILRERPTTFAIESDGGMVRFKQYHYGKVLIDFVVTIVDSASVPPAVATSTLVLKPWKRKALNVAFRSAGFKKISSFQDYARSRFTSKSKDLIIVAEAS